MSDLHITPEQADEYAIGAMSQESARALLLHTVDCERCDLIVVESRRVAATLTLGLPRHSPPPRLRRRVLRSAGILQPAPLRWAARLLAAGTGVAAIIIAIAALTGLVGVRSQVNDLRSENARLDRLIADTRAQEVQIAAISRELNDQQREATELQAAARGNNDLVLALLSPNSRIAEVFSVGDAAFSVGRFIWDSAQQKVWFVASRLPQLNDGRTYQLWVSSAGKFTSLGSFNADDAGLARFETAVPQGIKDYESAVVTIEPSPGVSDRSGPSVFVANLTGLDR